MSPGIKLERSGGTVLCTNAAGRTLYVDSAAHLHDGVLRLLGLSLDGFIEALERTEAGNGEDTVRSFAGALTEVRGLADLARNAAQRGSAVTEAVEGDLWLSWLAKAPTYGIVLDADDSFGWLVKAEAGDWIPESTPPEYDEDYFEGHDPTGVYSDYDADAEWRIEKARGLLGELDRLTPLRGGRALDVGSGYGYFRVALDEHGIRHAGIDVSRHAIRAAKRKYGFETLDGALSLHLDRLAGRFDLVTLWDVLEHVPDPASLLRDAAACLKPGGVLAIRTPSVTCPEAQILGPHYHSLQRPHLVYFSPASLRRIAADARLRELKLRTTSHFLRGFVGEAQVASWAAAERGSDIIAAFQKPPSLHGEATSAKRRD